MRVDSRVSKGTGPNTAAKAIRKMVPGVTHATVRAIIAAEHELIIQTVVGGGKPIVFPGFGKFIPKEFKGRSGGSNPMTGTPYRSKPFRGLQFHPSVTTRKYR